jgi:hypothetical protein
LISLKLPEIMKERSMNKLKDIIYDKNDLFIALIILVVAGLVIYSRIGIIMDYPEVLAAQAESNSSTKVEQADQSTNTDNENTESEETKNDTKDDKDNNDIDSNKKVSNTEKKDSNKTEKSSESKKSKVSIQIEPGTTGSQIAQILIDSGLIESKKEFYNAIKIAGAETRLTAGNFNIPSNATPDQIIQIITE